MYVYDGIPWFMTSDRKGSATLLAAYCGHGYPDGEKQVVAKSGYLTIYFEGSIEPGSYQYAEYFINLLQSSYFGLVV